MSKTAISLGAVIRQILLDNERVKDNVTKIYPIVADNAKRPYAVYRRVSINPEWTKWEKAEDRAVFQILIATEDYESGIELAENVRECFDGKNLTAYGVEDCKLTNAQETWMDDAYVQDLYFTIKM